MFKAFLSLLLIMLAAGCQREIGHVEKPVPDGDMAAGREAIIAYGCGACHFIPGVPNAIAYVGPPLNEFEQRHYIAGNLPNNVDNLISWIRNPQAVEPGTAMPDLHVTETDARNIVAYLYGQE